MNKLISIVTPNFNKSEFISETINSVINQTYSNWELIFVDDGSIDNSIDVINSFVENDNRIRLLKRDRLPKGGSTCRNIGLQHAKGDFVIFLDSDDLLIKSALENRIKEIERDKGFDFVVFPMGTFYKEIGDSKSVWIPPSKKHLSKFLSHDLPWSVMQPIWRKDFLLSINGFDEEFPRLQDVEMHTRALMKDGVKFRVFSDSKSDCFYRIDNNRVVDDYYTFIKKWMLGSLIYIEKTYQLIIDKDVDVDKRSSALRGTVLSIITNILYYSQVGKISATESEYLLEKLLNNKVVVDLVSIPFLKKYIRLYKFGFYKVKGFNFLSKKMLISQ